MVGCGIAVLSGMTHIRDPYANFRHPFEGSYWNGNALATAFVSKNNPVTLMTPLNAFQVKSNHAFSGWANAFNLMGEIRSNDPARTVRKASLISLYVVSALFLFINVAYVAAIPVSDMRVPDELVAILFFRRIFRSEGTAAFPLLVALNCFGSIVSHKAWFCFV